MKSTISKEDQIMIAFGRMVFGLITDVLVIPPDEGTAYAHRTVTTPDGKGGKHTLEIFVTRPDVATEIEAGLATKFAVQNVDITTKGNVQ